MISLCSQLSDKMTKEQYNDFILCIKSVRWIMKTITIEIESEIFIKTPEINPVDKKEKEHELRTR